MRHSEELKVSMMVKFERKFVEYQMLGSMKETWPIIHSDLVAKKSWQNVKYVKQRRRDNIKQISIMYR